MSVPKSSSEEELVACLRQGDSQSFEQFYDYFSGALFSVLLRLCPTRELAEDVLQEAFIKAWKNSQSYSTEKGRLFTWLLNIARNTAFDKLRNRTESQAIRNPGEDVYIYDQRLTTVMQPDHIGVKESVEKLIPEHKELISLAYFHGLTQEEIASRLEIPLGTVKTRMRSAMKVLRKIFS